MNDEQKHFLLNSISEFFCFNNYSLKANKINWCHFVSLKASVFIYWQVGIKCKIRPDLAILFNLHLLIWLMSCRTSQISFQFTNCRDAKTGFIDSAKRNWPNNKGVRGKDVILTWWLPWGNPCVIMLPSCTVLHAYYSILKSWLRAHHIQVLWCWITPGLFLPIFGKIILNPKWHLTSHSPSQPRLAGWS